MKSPLSPIGLNETSFEVARLHQILEALGLPVSEREAREHTAGPETVRQVRALQTQLNVRPDDRTLIDHGTTSAIAQALEGRGLTSTARSFNVAGSVRLRDGRPAKRQELLAFDLDLRAVAVYRDVQELSKLRAEVGFEFLGRTLSDGAGRYALTFYDWQYSRAERGRADVVVYAVSGERIVGRSRLVNSEDYSQTGLVRDLDVVIPGRDERTEYARLMEALGALLKESRTTLREIASSPAQVAFAAAELGEDRARVWVAAGAELLVAEIGQDRRVPHELLYGVGRQGVGMSWKSLYLKSDEELHAAVAASVERRIIRQFKDAEVAGFLDAVRERGGRQLLADEDPQRPNALNAMLSTALPEPAQRVAFLDALRTFRGGDYSEFWSKHLRGRPEFRDKPELVESLALTQRLTALSGNHQSLVRELRSGLNVSSVEQLLDLEDEDWMRAVKKSGAPDFVPGGDEAEKALNYVRHIETTLNAAFPTQRIRRMVEKNQLPIEKSRVSRGIASFLSGGAKFDFATSRVHDFDRQIKDSAGEDYEEVRSELMKLQRVYQVSTRPEAMAALMENKLHAAYTIANIPPKSFVKTYGGALGGDAEAYAIHQRASQIATRAEMTAARVMEYSHAPAPQYAMGTAEQTAAMTVLQNKLPSYAELFGSPDSCECGQCRSIFGAAAYLVDLLRFLWRGEPNSQNKTPLDLFSARRPDVLHLPLTCENTNTVIPYIDLANEVMEYYTVHDSITAYTGHDTGESTAPELRASPQNFNLEAYRTLSTAKYPFTLPYHQPLDAIRVYSDHLKVARHQAMSAMLPQPDASQARAVAAESLRMSPEQYRILTGEDFASAADATAVHELFGYAAAGDLENLNPVLEFMRRSGVSYPQLVELVETRFLNPARPALDFLQRIFSHATIDAASIYSKLEQIEAGTLDPSADPDITAALTAYNAAHDGAVTADDFGDWVEQNLAPFREVITLYEPDSKCSLDTTVLRTIQSIYDALPNSGIAAARWSKFHRFARLWRAIGWTIHETDLMLAALGQGDITPQAIQRLEAVSLLKEQTRLPVNQLAVLWGNIDTNGPKSLYMKLFLNKASQQIDPAFEPNDFGDVLTAAGELIAPHVSTIVAAFRIREEDLAAILEVARVIDAGVPRPIAVATDVLNLPNLSTLYRHVVLAKALKMRVPDFCRLISIFGAAPFSTWDIQQERYINVDPAATRQVYELAASAKRAGFKSEVLQYVVQGTLPPDSKIGLSPAKILQAAKAIRDDVSAIERDHLDAPPSPLTSALVAAKLAITFQPEVVARLKAILEGTAPFEAMADPNLNVIIPPALAHKYVYVKGSGRLTCAGVMTDAEQTTLKALPDADASFDAAVDELHAAPEEFIEVNFGGIFADVAAAKRTLLDHPAQAVPPGQDQKLTFVYQNFVPVLKMKLRRDAVARQIAALVGLTEEAATLLTAPDADTLVADLASAGLSATYFSDATLTTVVLRRTDPAVDFDWGTSAPDVLVPADNFSARWEAFIAPPASGEFTLLLDVQGADESFKLYLDDVLILQKAGGDVNTSWEVVATLNAAQMHRLRLEHADASQNAGIRLRWKTATTAPEVVPAAAAYPAAILDDFAALCALYHRAAKFILGFELSETELKHLISFPADFAGIDFKALTADHWTRVRDYADLRIAVPQAQAMLTDVFAAANRTAPAPTLAELKDLLHRATAWDRAALDFLVDTHFALGAADFKNEIALNHLRGAVEIVARTGVSAQTLAAWGDVETDFDALHATAQTIKNAVRAKYEEEDWLDLAAKLSNKLRERQRDALVGYLLTRPAIQAWGAHDADGLYEFFLIDVQMGSCMDTSRIVQAHGAVQMFVNRCLLNLESDTSTGAETGVSPSAIDNDRWQWMKYFRVRQAACEVLCTPENWLEPEWRNDRSDFFKDLESYLVQNDITPRTAEEGFRNYLSSLAEVANLEVCGLHRENHPDGKLKFMHVFARTNSAPYKFFYRRWNEHRKWSAWQKVPIDVRCVEAGPYSGVHLVPVVWKNRLFLFWPEFMEVHESQADTSDSMEDTASEPMSSLEPSRYWEVRLAWSEHADGKWTPKRLSSQFFEQDTELIPRESLLRFVYQIGSDNKLTLWSHVKFEGVWMDLGRFVLSDIASPIEAYGATGDVRMFEWSGYNVAFQTYRRNGKLQLRGDDYLNASREHRLLVHPSRQSNAPALTEPLFFKDAVRTYFVRPVPIRIRDVLIHPERHVPLIPNIVDDSGFNVPFDIPDLGPDDYLPVGLLVPEFAGVVRSRDDYQFEVLGEGAAAGRTMMMRSAAPRAAAPAFGAVTVRAAGAAGFANGKFHMSVIDGPFAGLNEHRLHEDMISIHTRHTAGLEFHTFYHPYSSDYVERLNRGGIPELMESDTELPSDNGATFEGNYLPNFTNGLVQKPTDFPTRTYYKENVCFDVYGANSLYNYELCFHGPLYIATRLSKNGKYEEAMKWLHYIFDPTTDEMPAPGESETSRYWKVLPFKTTPAETLEDFFRSLAPNTNPDAEDPVIAEWRANPFDPHLVASNRPLAYMKHVVIKYVENLIAWGDSLFRQDTMETVLEALQIYVIANHILGPRPQLVPRRGDIKAESYWTLRNKWDDFSNALVELENIFPYSSSAPVSPSSPGTSLLGAGSALYFCIPPNKKLLEYWDTVADRLYKIRHCQNIQGVERKLALFAPPIDPAALIRAASQGLSLGSILADLSSPPPIYRFEFLIQKANEFCADVKALGAALLSALEKKDAEELSRLRASHETQMLELLTAVRERNLLDARANRESLQKGREAAAFRLQHYVDLLGNSVSVPAAPTVAATLTADSQLPADTSIPAIASDVDGSLVDSDEGGVKLIPKEKEEIDGLNTARGWQIAAQAAEGIAGLLHIIPTVSADGKPFGVGAGASFGGTQAGNAASAAGKILDFIGAFSTHGAVIAAKMASYIRREQDWTLQANLAARDIVLLDKQLTSADIRIQVAQKELDNHKQQIENAKQVEQFLSDKFTNQELYQWMKEQIFSVYKQSYDLAYEMAKKAEKAYKYQTGSETASFISYGYWDGSQQGLAAGEKLQLALRQLEKSYLDENRRELELTRSFSLARLDPLELIKLRETGKCNFSIREELLDMDFRGHYYRRVKLVRLSMPSLLGPHTSVNCSLRLLNNSYRVNTSMNSEGKYPRENDDGVPLDDDRFRTSNVPVTAVATSSADEDSGTFEIQFRDERYLPFEGAGVISQWQMELSTDKELRQFDYSTISDVILHISYTAREEGGIFKEKAAEYIKEYIQNLEDLDDQPLVQLFSMKHEFPTQWHKFLHPPAAAGEQVLHFTLGRERFPYFVQDRDLAVRKVELFARCAGNGDYHMILSHTNFDDDVVNSSQITMPSNETYGGLKKTTVNVTDAGLNLDDLDVTGEMTLKIKRSAAAEFSDLDTDPDEIDDLYLVAHYKLGPLT